MVILRKAVKDDAIKFIEYTKVIGSETDFLSYGSEGIKLSINDAKDLFDKYNSSPDSLFLLAFDGDFLVGSGNINRGKGRRRHRSEIGIAVRKDYWGIGIAKSILHDLIEFGSSINIQYIDLTVRADNQRAISLYKEYGFEKNCTIKSDIKIHDEYYDSIMMVLDLKQANKL